ncbi:hypothetical protein L9F63_022191, partial [Diploptera punctata]
LKMFLHLAFLPINFLRSWASSMLSPLACITVFMFSFYVNFVMLSSASIMFLITLFVTCSNLDFLALLRLSYIFGCDYIYFGLIILRLWICVLIILARESVFRVNYFGNLFRSIIIILLLLLVCTFRRMRFFTFYLFFERSLIPTLFLILGWGYQPERLQAGIYLLFYTLLASVRTPVRT